MADIQVQVIQYKNFSIHLPMDHMLSATQNIHPLYDRFLPHLCKYLESNSTVVDIGANCGDTLAAMFDLNQTINFICIEPDDLFFNYLNHNVQRILEIVPTASIQTIKSLVGKNIYNVSLDGPASSKKAIVGGGSIVSSTLDQLLTQSNYSNISLIKIDVDGFDYDVIDSSEKTINEFFPLIFFECQHDHEYQKIAYEKTLAELQTKGYNNWAVFDNFGNFILQSTNLQQLTQFFDYVWRQNSKLATRTIYYFDILAIPKNKISLIDRVIADYTQGSTGNDQLALTENQEGSKQGEVKDLVESSSDTANSVPFQPSQRRIIGRTGISVQAVGMGCVSLSVPLPNHPPPTEEDAIKVIHTFLERGGDFIDTSNVYCKSNDDLGHNERLIAAAIKDGGWKDIRVATKVGVTRPFGFWVYQGDPSWIRYSCEQSLRALDVERIFLYQLHNVDLNVPFLDTISEMVRLQAEGKVEHIGLCNVNKAQIQEAMTIARIETVQNCFNIFQRHDLDNGLISFCAEQGITYLAHSPVGGIHHHTQLMADTKLREIAASLNVSTYTMALAWVLTTGPSVLPIPGASRIQSVLGCHEALDIAHLLVGQ